MAAVGLVRLLLSAVNNNGQLKIDGGIIAHAQAGVPITRCV